ncbi:MAG: pilus assembly protein TadG-related protein [Planctomycetaceae bacterium]
MNNSRKPQPNDSNRSIGPRDTVIVREGKILVLFAVLLPALLTMAGLVIDGSLMMAEYRGAQHVADAAATAAARVLQMEEGIAAAQQRAREVVQAENGLTDAEVSVNIPPEDGPYAGNANFVEVEIVQPTEIRFYNFVGGQRHQKVRTRAVAGFETSTAPAAIVVLDPDPKPFALPPLVGLPSLPSLLGGLEVLGAGQLRVDGALIVNTEWGGVDEDNNPSGNGPSPPYGASCTPLLSLTKVLARDIRVVGGVDDPKNYGHFTAGKSSPLTANSLPVPDPLANLPVPTTSVDPTNVVATSYGGVQVIGLPLLPPRVLNPGVYDWIEIVSGRVTFTPGVYIIRSVNPITQIGLNVLAGQVTADGVMFYITNNGGYSLGSGSPDSGDGETAPAAPGVGTLLPSAVINVGLLGSQYSGLDDPGSPFDGMMIYQRRQDRRPIVIINDDLLNNGSFGGRVYAKWGHVIVAGKGLFDASFVAGTMRVIALLNMTLAPSQPLPPAEDVYLVE